MRRFAPLAVLAATLLHGSLVQAAEPLAIDVHRDANCGCCKDWIKHLEANGFKVTDHVEADMSAVKSRLGVPYSMGSCHTGVIDGKFVEGHVPAADILKLRERADLVAPPYRACRSARRAWKWATARTPTRSSA